jgi:hypothetical protein
VVRPVPFHFTVVPEVKFDPVTVMMIFPEPAVLLLGDSVLIVGTLDDFCPNANIGRAKSTTRTGISDFALDIAPPVPLYRSDSLFG